MRWMDRLRGQLNVGAAQFHDFAKGGGWRARLIHRNYLTLPGRDDPATADQSSAEIIETVSDLIQKYKSSRWFYDISATTKKSYGLYLDRIDKKFGT